MRVWAVLVVVLAGLVFAGVAAAGGPSVIDQYQEQIPTAIGGNHDGGNGGGSGLSQSTQQNLESSVSAPVAAALEEVATSPSLGAPDKKAHAKHRKSGRTAMTGKETRPGAIAPTQDISGSPLSDAVSAAANGGDGHVLAVVVALALITLGGGAAAVYGRRRSSGA